MTGGASSENESQAMPHPACPGIRSLRRTMWCLCSSQISSSRNPEAHTGEPQTPALLLNPRDFPSSEPSPFLGAQASLTIKLIHLDTFTKGPLLQAGALLGEQQSSNTHRESGLIPQPHSCDTTNWTKLSYSLGLQPFGKESPSTKTQHILAAVIMLISFHLKLHSSESKVIQKKEKGEIPHTEKCLFIYLANIY